MEASVHLVVVMAMTLKNLLIRMNQKSLKLRFINLRHDYPKQK
jgi:hypothetical protein